ncbi:serine hydrolase domain-containing protein [Actinokineospora sp. HUAS TT18]|uniref:serine hydrolase domain-containing protein n=1 Tax=Actinokineospora sp. HUAS TT18 TaxID=3447451 RepID=UPI003F5232D2
MGSVRGIGRRRLLAWGGLTAAAAPLAGTRLGHAEPGKGRIPPDTRPGGVFDRYVAELAAQGGFSGVILLSHRGRTVLSRAYGMADKERGVRNHEGTAFNLSSAGKPFGAVAILQLVQQGKVLLSDTVGTYLTGFAKEIAEQVTVHHLLSGASGLDNPEVDVQRVFQSREEVRAYCEAWARRARQVAAPGTPTDHAGAEVAIPAMIVEAVSGMTYWDYVEENIFRRAGMTGSAFYTRPRWLTDEHIAHPYMRLADGSLVDAVRNLDLSSPDPWTPGKNPGRDFIDPPGDGGFTTAPDLVRFAHALRDGTLLERPYADVLTAPRTPLGPAPGGLASSVTTSFGAYHLPVHITGGQWVYDRAGANPGIAAGWSIYPDTDWVGVMLSNADGLPLGEILQRQEQAIVGPWNS